MATYYIDQLNGNDALDGLTPEAARKNYTDIDVQAGDLVLFKRGSFYREMLYAIAGVSYGSYGEGELPTFCGSTDVSAEEDWIATETPNVWKCIKPIFGDVGNMAFNENDCTATFRWTKEELCAQGDFFDERIWIKGIKSCVLSAKFTYARGAVRRKKRRRGYRTQSLGNGLDFDRLFRSFAYELF